MRKFSAVLGVSLGLSTIPPSRAAGTLDTVKIVIAGGDLSAPIEITDPAVLVKFKVAAGPGMRYCIGCTELREMVPIVVHQGFIIDWDRGSADSPLEKLFLQGLTTYTVSFVTTRQLAPRRPLRDSHNPGTYVVGYAIDPATNQGYVYLPGKGDPGYQDDVSFLIRGVEGNWFHAWSEWEKVANPLIARGRGRADGSANKSRRNPCVVATDSADEAKNNPQSPRENPASTCRASGARRAISPERKLRSVNS